MKRQYVLDLKEEKTQADGALVRTEYIKSATKVSPNVGAYQGIQPWNRLYYGVYEDLQETEAFDRQINEKNVWFRPHIKYSSLKNGPDFTFAEKIQLQNALDQIIRISSIAIGFCHSSNPDQIDKKSMKFIHQEDRRFIEYLYTILSKKKNFIVITDMRDRHNPEIANKSYQDIITWESKIDVAQGGSSVWIGSDFFRFGLTPEQRAIILYKSIINLASWNFKQNMVGRM